MKTKMKTSASIFLYAVFYLLVYPLQSQENKNENNTIFDFERVHFCIMPK